MTAVWIVIVIVGIIAMVATPFVEDCINITNSGMISFISGAVIFIVGAICFFAVPITGYMEVESTHWRWTVDVYTYSAVNKSDSTGHKSSGWMAEKAAEEAIPDGAYNINIETHSGSRTVTDSEGKDADGKTYKQTHKEYYYWSTYSYTVEEWVKTEEVVATGKDKNPYEPERPYDTVAPDELGNKKCPSGHNEYYSVTGKVEKETKTYDISKSDWERISDTDEFTYCKYRLGDEIFDLEIAQ